MQERRDHEVTQVHKATQVLLDHLGRAVLWELLD